MKSIYYIIVFLFFNLGLFAQKPNKIDVQIFEIEKNIKQFLPQGALKKIDSLLLAKNAGISPKNSVVIKALKVEALQQAELYYDAMKLSNEIYNHPELPLEHKFRLILQRELIFEILGDLKKAKQSLQQASNLLNTENLKENHYYGYYLIRNSSFYRISKKDSLAELYARKAKNFGIETNDKDISANAAMLLGFLEDKANIKSQRCYYESALENWRTLEDNHGTIAMYYALAKTYKRQQKHEIALTYLDSIISNTSQQQDLIMLAYTYKTKSSIYEDLNLHKTSLENYKLFKEYHDKYGILKKSLALKQLGFRSEIEKEKLQRDAVVENLKNVESYNKNLIVLAVILLIVLVILAYLFVRISQNNRYILKQQKKISQKNRKLASLVTEKQLLLKEVHHRVKNNLSLILSMISFQRNKIKNANFKQEFQVLSNRIKAVSIVHEQLLQREGFPIEKNHNIKTYVEKIARALIDLSGKNIIYKSEIEYISLPLNTSVPIGILINELISNSIKYAEPLRGDLILSIRIKEFEKKIIIQYCDNGIIKNQTFNKDGLGLFIINNMVSQLDGLYKKEDWSYTISLPK